MSKVGYVINYAGYGTDVDKEWMKRFGCTEIMEEKQECGPLRAEWNKLLRRLNKGDELVVPKLSYIIRETRQLSYLLEYCRLKEIRLISIHDCIDSGNELFPETQMSDILNVVAKRISLYVVKRGLRCNDTAWMGFISPIHAAIS